MTSLKADPIPAKSLRRLDQADRATSELRLSSRGLRGYWLVDTRSHETVATQMLVQEEFGNLERIMAATPEIFQAGVSMELIGAGEDQPPVEYTELILVGDSLVAAGLHDPRGRFGIAAILAPEANIALELNALRSALSALEPA